MKAFSDFDLLVRRFDRPEVRAIVLMDSYARGNPGLFSDVDLVRFAGEAHTPFPDDGSHLIDDFLVTVSSVNTKQVEEWFSRPEVAVNVIAGVRTARPLLDRHNTFEAIQRRAQAFAWDKEMQHKANRWASQQMVGWIEEVHKGLEGLRHNDVGRLLNARHGCSWGLSRVMAVQRGVLLTSDNSFYDEVRRAVGLDSEWAQLYSTAFGVEGPDGRAPSLREQVLAGLRLYAVTAKLLVAVLEAGDARLVEHTVNLIKTTLGQKQ